jgi:N-acetylneuraminic acid mutarotase
LKKLLGVVVFLVVCSIQISYSQEIIPPLPEPPSTPFEMQIIIPNQTFPSGKLFVETPEEPSEEIWENLAPMPTPRTEVAVAAIDHKIYVLGGFDRTNRATDVVEVYNIISNTWETSLRLPIPMHHVGATSYSGEIYVIGGYLEGWRASNSLYIYNPESGWREGAAMPTKRGALTVQFVDGILYAVGGADRIALDVVESYSPENDSWISKNQMPTARDHLASAVVDSKMYVVGGRIITLATNIGTNEVYDPFTNSWNSLESMPTARGGITAASIAETFFVFGGESNTGTFSQNEQYIPGTGWFSRESMPTARHGLGAVTVGDRIYVIGGGIEPGVSVSAVNEAYYNAKFIPEFGVLSFLVLGVLLGFVIMYFGRLKNFKYGLAK